MNSNFPMKGVKTARAADYQRLSNILVVECGYKLSNKFIEDLRKIHDYIEYFHINLTT